MLDLIIDVGVVGVGAGPGVGRVPKRH